MEKVTSILSMLWIVNTMRLYLHFEWIEWKKKQEEILQWAIRSENIKFLEVAKKRGWNLNKEYNFMKPIHVASENGSEEIVSFLIESGVNVNERNTYKIILSTLHVQMGTIELSSCS